MIFVLNTCLNQLTGKVNCDWVWNSHSRNKSKYFNGQVGLNQLAGSKDCDEIEYWYNLNELGLNLNDQIIQKPNNSFKHNHLNLAKLNFL